MTKEKIKPAPSEFAIGVRDAVPMIAPVLVFGAIFGATARASGFSTEMILWASATIFAGASQFVFLEVYGLGVPGWSVVLAVFAVNFRHLLYSAAIGMKIDHFAPFQRLAAFFLLTDIQFAAAETHYERTNKLPISMGFYFGFAAVCYWLWIIGTVIGAVFGALIEDPELFGLDFILPIYFLVILMGFRQRPNFLVVVVISATVAFGAEKTLGAPWHISLGAIAGILSAALLSLVQTAEKREEDPVTAESREHE